MRGRTAWCLAALLACGADDEIVDATTVGNGGAAGSGGEGTGASSKVGVCEPNTTEDCYEGPSETLGIGPCTGGTHTCNAAGSAWSECAGQVLPGIDDCRTTADEDCDGANQPCPTGTPLWSKSFGGPDWQEPYGVAVDANGNGIIGGSFQGAFSLGGPTFTPIGVDAFLAKLDASGTHVWSKHFPSPGTQEIRAVAMAPNGDIVVAGTFWDQIDLGGGPLITSQQWPNVFVARLDASGNHLWSKAAGALDEYEFLYGLAVDPSGNVFVCGYYTSVIDFGGVPLIANYESTFVAKLDPSGVALWAKSIGGPSNEQCLGLASDANGDVLVAGGFVGPADIGAGLISGSGGDDVFLTRFDPAGNTLFALPFGDSSAQAATDVAVDPAGNILLAGKFYGTLDFGGGPLQNGTIFVAKLTANGTHLASEAYAPAGNMSGAARLAVDPFSNPVVVGEFTGTLDFGGTLLMSPFDNVDLFFAKLDPLLGHWWSRSAGNPGPASEDTRDVATDSEGNVWVVGRFENTIDLGTGPLMPLGSTDTFVVKYAH